MKKYFIKGTDKEAKFGTNFTLRGTIDEDNIDFLLSSNERLERTVRTLEKKIDSLKTTVASIVKCCHNG